MSVQQIFGKYAAEIKGEIQLFDTESEANTAVAVEKNGAHHLALALSYTNARGLQGKNAQGKINVITDFLAFADTLSTNEIAEPAPVQTEDEIEF